MPLDLSVPYTDKDQAKNLGALWMPERKTWVIPDHIPDIGPFSAWIPFQKGCIVRKPHLVCLSKTNCWKCGKITPMISLGATNYFTIEYADVDDSENELQLWLKVKEPTLFSSILTLDKQIVDHLHSNYPFFKRIYSYTANETCYKNTCTACGILQGDFYHHEEPGGAFFPDPFSDEPNAISFKHIDLERDYHIDADHGGMAYDEIYFPKT